MKKLIALLSIVVLVLTFSCEKEKYYICDTRTDVGTTLEATTTETLCDMPMSPSEWERTHSSVVYTSKDGEPMYYSQTITTCKEKK